jgi:hypothetical protein
MKRLYSLILLVSVCCVFASTPGIQGKVTSFGIFRVAGKEEIIPAPEMPSGLNRIIRTDDAILVSSTNVIPAKIGVRFGMKYEISNLPGPDGLVVVTEVAKHPRITKPDGTTADGFTSVQKYLVHEGKIVGFTGYSFDHDYELAAGSWEFEMQYGGKTVCSQKFIVVKE